jgi:hypothetical protein
VFKVDFGFLLLKKSKQKYMTELSQPFMDEKSLREFERTPVRGILRVFESSEKIGALAVLTPSLFTRMGSEEPLFAKECLEEHVEGNPKEILLKILKLPTDANEQIIRQRLSGGVVVQLDKRLRNQGVVTDEGRKDKESLEDYRPRRKGVRSAAYFALTYYQNQEKRKSVQNRARENIRYAREKQKTRENPDSTTSPVYSDEVLVQFHPTLPEGREEAGPIVEQVLEILNGSTPEATVPFEEICLHLYGSEDEAARARTKKMIQKARQALEPYDKTIRFHATWAERYAKQRGQYFIDDLKNA